MAGKASPARMETHLKSMMGMCPVMTRTRSPVACNAERTEESTLQSADRPAFLHAERGYFEGLDRRQGHATDHVCAPFVKKVTCGAVRLRLVAPLGKAWEGNQKLVVVARQAIRSDGQPVPLASLHRHQSHNARATGDRPRCLQGGLEAQPQLALQPAHCHQWAGSFLSLRSRSKVAHGLKGLCHRRTRLLSPRPGRPRLLAP